METEWLRDDLTAALLTGTAAIRRVTGSTSDGMGGRVPVWTTVATVACSLQQRDVPPEAVTAGRSMARSVWEVYLPAGTDVRPRDVLRIAGHDYALGDDDDDRTDGLVLKVHAARLT